MTRNKQAAHRRRIRMAKRKLDEASISHSTKFQGSNLPLHPIRDIKRDWDHRQQKSYIHIHRCDVIGCNKIWWDMRGHTAMRGHTMDKHLPSVLRERYLADRSFQNRRMKLLYFLKCKIVGKNMLFVDLVAWVNGKKAMSQDINVQEADINWLTRICREQRWQVPNQFTLVPVNSVALLFHWCVLPLLLNELSEEERMAFKQENVIQTIKTEDDVKIKGDTKVVVQQEVGQAVKMKDEVKVFQQEKVGQDVKIDKDVKVVVQQEKVGQAVTIKGDTKVVVQQEKVGQAVPIKGDAKVVVQQEKVGQAVTIKGDTKVVVQQEKVGQAVKIKGDAKVVVQHETVGQAVKIKGDPKVVVQQKKVGQAVKIKGDTKVVVQQEKVCQPVKIKGDAKVVVQHEKVGQAVKIKEDAKVVVQHEKVGQAVKIKGDTKVVVQQEKVCQPVKIKEDAKVVVQHEKVGQADKIKEDAKVVVQHEKVGQAVKIKGDTKVVVQQEKVGQVVKNKGDAKVVVQQQKVGQAVKIKGDPKVVVQQQKVGQAVKIKGDTKVFVQQMKVSQAVKMEEEVKVVLQEKVGQAVKIKEDAKVVVRQKKVGQAVKIKEDAKVVVQQVVSQTVKMEEDVAVVMQENVSQTVKMKEDIKVVNVSQLEAFDSYFHFDCLSQSLSGNIWEALSDLITADVGCISRTSVSVMGGIMVFSDPETFPESLPSISGFGSAIGIQPKKCPLLTKEMFQTILRFLTSYDIVALGDIGLDWTEPESSWELQECTMTRLLQFSMPVRPVILHMREKMDQHAGNVSARCLQIMKANVAPTQKIHLHSFSGTVCQVVAWLKAFPNCFFSFSENVASFDHYQIAALQRVPDNRLLLESDSSGFKSVTDKVITPALLGDIGEVVGKHRGRSLTDIIQLTRWNGRHLYSL